MKPHPTHPRKRLHLLALGLLLSAASHAQTPATPSPTSPGAPNCADAEASSAQLYGVWQLSLWPEHGSEAQATSRGSLQLRPHPEYPGSVYGQVQRTQAGQTLQAWVSGDLLDGDFNLDESADAVDIDAIWVGQASDCGHTLRGSRLPAERLQASTETLQFVLRKQPSAR